jgi:tetratricopeptide (TPR) repeat protein
VWSPGRRRLAIAVAAATLAAAGAPATVRADDKPALGAPLEGPLRPDAQALYDRGLARFQARAYAEAVADFEAGYALDPRREFLFAEAQAKRLAGDCKGAVALYERFLTTDPPALQVNATHIGLGRCAQHLAAHPDVVMVEPPPPPPPAPAPLPRWWHDGPGLALGAAGVVALGVGVGFLIAGSTAQDDAGMTGDLAAYNRVWSTAETRRGVGVTALVTGVVLMAAGAGRFVMVRRQTALRESSVGVSFGANGLVLRGTF